MVAEPAPPPLAGLVLPRADLPRRKGVLILRLTPEDVRLASELARLRGESFQRLIPALVSAALPVALAAEKRRSGGEVAE